MLRPTRLLVERGEFTLTHVLSLILTTAAMTPVLWPIVVHGHTPTLQDSLFAVALYPIAERLCGFFVARNERQHLDNRLIGLNERLQDIYKIRRIPTKTQAISEIVALSDEIQSIRNTHLVSDDRMYYTEDELEYFRTVFSTVLGKKRNVVDLFGGIAGSRAIKKHADLSYRFSDEPTYTPLALEGVIPIVNFMLLDLGESKSVYFGWGGHRFADTGGEVFQTWDPALVALFEKQFLSLESMAVPRPRKDPANREPGATDAPVGRVPVQT
jgi:hypothetical protein